MKRAAWLGGALLAGFVLRAFAASDEEIEAANAEAEASSGSGGAPVRRGPQTRVGRGLR